MTRLVSQGRIEAVECSRFSMGCPDQQHNGLLRRTCGISDSMIITAIRCPRTGGASSEVVCREGFRVAKCSSAACRTEGCVDRAGPLVLRFPTKLPRGFPKLPVTQSGWVLRAPSLANA